VDGERVTVVEFRNWSGNLVVQPSEVATPSEEQQVVALVRDAAAQGVTVRPVGEGHSFSPLVDTNGVLVSLRHLTGLR
jgi:FAD/FMN-containing dehydrogenase